MLLINPYRFGVSAPADPYFNNVSLLLHGDGADGSTTIVDSSPRPKTPTIFGNARISTAQSKFGPSSLVGGSAPDFIWGTNRIQYSPGVDFQYGTDDFTVEYWVYPLSQGVGKIVYSQAVSGTNYFMSGITNLDLPFFVFAVSGGGAGVFGPVISMNTWSHVAIVRHQGVAVVYSNGVGGTQRACTQDFNNATYPPNIGGYSHAPSTDPNRGYVDEFRITKGVARYTANFTPPAAPFPDF